MSARVLITGANGFVGSHLISAIAQREPTWTVLRVGGPESFDCDYRLDLTDAAAVDDIIRDAQPTLVIHLAAVAAVGSSVRDPRQAWAVNVDGTLNIVLGIERNAPGAHLLYVSSAEVYGASFNSGEAVDEHQLIQPLNPYAASKAAAEIIVMQAARNGLRAAIARPFNHTGSGQSRDFVMPAFAEQIALIEAGKAPPILKVGNLDDERDFTDVRDIVEGYISLAQHLGRSDVTTVVNFASGKSYRIRDLLDEMLATSSISIGVEIDPARYRPARVGKVVGDVSRAAALLDWRAKIPIRETLASVLSDYRTRVSTGRT